MSEDRYMACLIKALQKEEPEFEIYPLYDDFGIGIQVNQDVLIPFDKSEVRKLKGVSVGRVAEAVIALIWDRLTHLTFTPIAEDVFDIQGDVELVRKPIEHDVVLNKLSFLEKK